MVDLSKMQDNVNSLQKDMAQVGVLVERLDITIEKLTEMSSYVSKMLAVQVARLDSQEKIADKLQDHVEKSKRDTDMSFKEVYDKISKVEQELIYDMEETKDKVIQKIDELGKTGQKQHSELQERITGIERWMWLLIGGGTIMGFVLNNSEIITKILN